MSHLHSFTSGSSSLLDSPSLSFFFICSCGVMATGGISIVCWSFLALLSTPWSSSDNFCFFSCLYYLPTFLCSFLPDMTLWILLFGIPYFFAISTCDLLLAMQSPMVRSNSIEQSPMVFCTLCILSLSVVP